MDDLLVVGNGQNLTLTHKWEIENWLSYQALPTGKKLFSPPFEAMSDSWSLYIYPNGRNEEYQEYISLSLACHFKNNVPVHVRYLFSLLIDDKDIIATSDSKTKFTFGGENKAWGPTKLVSKATVIEYLRATSTSKIIVVCQISADTKGLSYTLKSCNHVAGPSNALESFVNNVRLSDVKFIVDGKEIFAHKMILSARSPVFAAMFQHVMRENEENIVTVEDIGYDAFLYLLRYIYTGKCDFVEDSPVGDLFKAADKYQLLWLKNACEQQLHKTITVDNVIEYLTLADVFNAMILKKLALNFIVAHGKEMIGKPEMEALKNLNSCLFNDVLKAIFTHVN